MIVALPCGQFSSKEREIIKSINPSFLTFPEFLDNFYVRYARYKDVNFRKLFLRVLRKHLERVEFVVYPDYQYDMSWLLRKYRDKKWIFPLHKKEELDFILEHGFEWVGMPHRKQWRDYSVKEFLLMTSEHGLKRWYLGWWDEHRWQNLLRFHGFDTTLPEYYAYKCAKIWYAPMRAKYVPWKYESVELFKINVENFSKFVKSLNISFTKWRWFYGGV